MKVGGGVGLGGGGVAWANSSSLTFLWGDSRFSDTHGLVAGAGGCLGGGVAVGPLLRCSGAAAGLHLRLQQAPLPHLSPLRKPTRTGAGQTASARGAVEKVRMCGGTCLPRISVRWWPRLWRLKPIFPPGVLNICRTSRRAGFRARRPGIALSFV